MLLYHSVIRGDATIDREYFFVTSNGRGIAIPVCIWGVVSDLYFVVGNDSI